MMSRTHSQPDLFAPATLPDGFRYQTGVLTPEEEHRFIGRFETLPFEHFDFHGYRGHRRIVSFGWRYDYAARLVRPSAEIPSFLEPLRDRAGAFAQRPAQDFEQILVTEYAPGAGIGWHKDKPHFGEVVAFSFASACTLRFRREYETGWDRRAQAVEPRSAYILTGPSRWEWQHSIPAVDGLRYSVTLRTWHKRSKSPE